MPRASGSSLQAWSDVAHNFRGDLEMLWKEIIAGFLIAGYVSLLPHGFFNALFITHAWAPLRIAENVLVGPIVAALAFVCSIGNVPLAAVLWAGGISFAGVIAFLFADLIVLPIVAIYRKFYGGRAAALLAGVMFGAMVLAALVVDGLFSLVGLAPVAPAVDRVGRRAAGDVELHLGARPLRGRGLRRADRADGAPWREGPGVRHDRRPCTQTA